MWLGSWDMAMGIVFMTRIGEWGWDYGAGLQGGDNTGLRPGLGQSQNLLSTWPYDGHGFCR